MTLEETINRLSKSKFRSSFKLSKKDKEYYFNKGEDIIRSHACDFVRDKLVPKEPLNDGRQTPMHGHPVFKAMHACACCCRGCLNKWYHVKKDVELTQEQQEKIVNLIMYWINNEIKK